MQTQTAKPVALHAASRPRLGIGADLTIVPVAPATLPAVVDDKPAKNPFSAVDSLKRELAILNAAPSIWLLGCAVSYGVTQALNPNSWGEALVCLAPFVVGIATPFAACAIEAKRRERDAASQLRRE